MTFLPLIVASSFAFYLSSTRSLLAKMDVVSMQFQTTNIGTVICVPALFPGGAFSIKALTYVLQNLFLRFGSWALDFFRCFTFFDVASVEMCALLNTCPLKLP